MSLSPVELSTVEMIETAAALGYEPEVDQECRDDSETSYGPRANNGTTETPSGRS